MIYATIWQRILAFVVDMIVFLPLLFLGFMDHSRGGLLAATAASILIHFGYQVCLHALYGQTLGKRVMRIRVIRIDGQNIGWREALLRSSVDLALQIPKTVAFVMVLFAIPDAAFPFASMEVRAGYFKRLAPAWTEMMNYVSWGWAIIDPLTYFTNAQGRTLHDMIAGTVVVKVIDPVASAQ